MQIGVLVESLQIDRCGGNHLRWWIYSWEWYLWTPVLPAWLIKTYLCWVLRAPGSWILLATLLNGWAVMPRKIVRTSLAKSISNRPKLQLQVLKAILLSWTSLFPSFHWVWQTGSHPAISCSLRIVGWDTWLSSWEEFRFRGKKTRQTMMNDSTKGPSYIKFIYKWVIICLISFS